MYTNYRAMGLGLMVSMGACSSPEPYWAVQHAEVTLTGDTMTGYQTWEFYSKRWRRNKNEKFHICARVQVIEGVATEALAGCRDCDLVYKVTTTELEADCEEGVGEGRSFAAATHYGLGPLTEELSEQNTFDDVSHGWWVSWDAQSLEPLGYAWSEESGAAALDSGDLEASSEIFVLWPGYAWQL